MSLAKLSVGATRAINGAIRSSHVALLCAVLLVLAPVLLLWQALPALARWLPDQIPVAWERPLGEYVLRSHSMLAPASELPEATQQRLTQRILALARHAGIHDARVEFRNAPPNAAALPGNIVVITDGLVRVLGRDELIDAVVAHELGHLHHRHALRQAISREVLIAVAFRLNGQENHSSQTGTLVADLTLVPHHSREAEREADNYAHALLRGLGHSPMLLGEALQQMVASAREQAEGKTQALYTASHPPTPQRIDAARRAAQ